MFHCTALCCSIPHASTVFALAGTPCIYHTCSSMSCFTTVLFICPHAACTILHSLHHTSASMSCCSPLHCSVCPHTTCTSLHALAQASEPRVSPVPACHAAPLLCSNSFPKLHCPKQHLMFCLPSYCMHILACTCTCRKTPHHTSASMHVMLHHCTALFAFVYTACICLLLALSRTGR